MLTRPDPDVLLAGPLGQWLAGEDGNRRAARERAAKIQYATVAVACLLAFIVVLVAPNGVATALKLGLFVGLGGFALAEWSKRGVIRTIKGGLNSAIAQALDMNYAAEVKPGTEFDLARNFQLVPTFERSSFEDLWSGTVGDQSFQLYEAKLEVERSSGDRREWVKVFEGSIISIGFARRFNGVTLVERQGQRKKLFGLLGEKDEITLDGIVLQRIEMVDPRFEDQFTVWSNDQVESRYLVHPEYVERLIAVEQAFAGEKVRCLFNEGRLIVALESGNLFESGSLDSSNDRALLQKTIDQFGTLVDLSVELNERPR